MGRSSSFSYIRSLLPDRFPALCVEVTATISIGMLLVACLATFAYGQEKFERLPKPDNDRANLYIYRALSSESRDARIEIYLNGRSAVLLGKGEYHVISVSQGEHQIEAFLPITRKRHVGSRTVTVRAGIEYFIELSELSRKESTSRNATIPIGKSTVSTIALGEDSVSTMLRSWNIYERFPDDPAAPGIDSCRKVGAIAP